MTPLQKHLLAVRKELRILHAYEQSIAEELKATCDHPLVEIFQWEHDTGYGRQSKVSGERCTLCGLERRWRGVGCWR